MSAGLGTPVITFASCPVSYAETVESVQLDTRILVPAITTPSNPPAPLAMTLGALSPGFQASTDFVGPNDTMMNRLPTGSTVIPLGQPRLSPRAATVTLRSGPMRKTRSGPGCSTLPTSSNRMPVSVTQIAPVEATVTSFKKTAPPPAPAPPNLTLPR